MTPATQSEPVPGLAQLQATALAARSLGDVLCRLADWWQAATGADEVVVTAGNAAGDGMMHAVRRGDRTAEILPDAGSDVAAPPVPVSPAARTFRLLEADTQIGVLQLIGDRLAEPPAEWIAVTTALLAHTLGFERRLRDDKLAALAEFAAGAGHEINNPLATILICAQRLQQLTSDPEQRRLLATIGGQALRVRDMIGDAMLFARPPSPQVAAVNLSAAVADVLGRLTERCAEAGIRVDLHGPSDLSVLADPTQLRVAISELLRNAIEAQPAGGHIEIAWTSGTPGSEPHAVLRVADAGSGLDEESRQHLFDPFYSGRSAGRGLGFGLSKVWRIVGLHGGRVDIVEPPGGGLAVNIRWPSVGGGA